MGRKRHKPEEIIAKLRQVDVLTAHDGRYRRYGSYGLYGAPFLAYGAYAGSCGWLYRNAVATGDPYWWNRYYECVGYY